MIRTPAEVDSWHDHLVNNGVKILQPPKTHWAVPIDSPRGPLSFNKAHNPIQNIYLREVRNGRNEMVSIAQKDVDDPARGCKLA